MADDSLSVASETSNHSSSNCKMECPECKIEITLKYLFAHIRLKHPGFFHQITTRKWLEDASEGLPLKLMWEVKDDFDDSKVIIIYGCLSTDKTFKSESRALAHFKKNKDAFKDHNKQIKQLIKTRKIFLKSQTVKKPDQVDAFTLRWYDVRERDDEKDREI
jgi:hypothetical protein